MAGEGGSGETAGGPGKGSFEPLSDRGVTGGHPEAGGPDREHHESTEPLSEGVDSAGEISARYDQRQVVGTYRKVVEQAVGQMARQLAEIPDAPQSVQLSLQVLQGLLTSVRLEGDDQWGDLAFRISYEWSSARAEVEAEAERASAGSSGPGSSADVDQAEQDREAEPDKRKAWAYLRDIVLEASPNVWKLIAHLGTAREWTVERELKADAVFVKGAMKISVTFDSGRRAENTGVRPGRLGKPKPSPTPKPMRPIDTWSK